MYTEKYWTGLVTFLKTWSAKTWLVHLRLGRIIKDFLKASIYFLNIKKLLENDTKHFDADKHGGLYQGLRKASPSGL